MWTHCPFCHQQVLTEMYAEHERAHTRRRQDGQMDEHITLPPEQRLQGDLSGVPRIYLHWNCGAKTQMPDEIIRSYLQNPFLYSGMTFCAGCHDYVPEHELTWVDTGESLSVYMQRLRDNFLAKHPDQRPFPNLEGRSQEARRIPWLLLSSVLLLPLLVAGVVVAHHAAPKPAPIVTPVRIAATPEATPSAPVALPPPVVLSRPSTPDSVTPAAVPSDNGVVRPFPFRSASSQGEVIRQVALAAVPDFIRRFHPVQTSTGTLTTKAVDVFQSTFSQAIVTVHYEVTETPDNAQKHQGAIQMLLLRRGAVWEVMNMSPLVTG